jgi:hypothetical protein
MARRGFEDLQLLTATMHGLRFGSGPSGGFPHPHRVLHLACDRHHNLPGKRRTARARPADGGHEFPRTTKLYDRTKDEITLSAVERIRL